jgi:hypothetical protein
MVVAQAINTMTPLPRRESRGEAEMADKNRISIQTMKSKVKGTQVSTMKIYRNKLKASTQPNLTKTIKSK